MSLVTYDRRGYVGVLTVNRPEALNALNSEVIEELSLQLDGIEPSNIRCLIVTGAGKKAFVAGADIAEMLPFSQEAALAFSNAGNTVMERLENLCIPVIAAVNGYALGGGCELALACDIRIVSEKAVFGLPEVTLGILPGYGGIQRLIRAVGLPKAKQLVFTAEKIKAPEALAMGLANQICAPEELMNAAMCMAERIAGNAPYAICCAKEVANRSVGLTQKESNRLEKLYFAHCFHTEDRRNAMEAFVNKTKPEPFTGF